MKVPVEQHYSKVDGEFVLTSSKYIEVGKQTFAEKMAAFIEKSFSK
nr:MAG TPA: hypothetical protein [Caudoviricetes sp.]